MCGDFDGLHPAIFELDAGAGGSHRARSVAAHGDDVCPLDLTAWMRQLVRGIAVVRHDENALCHVVEATDVGEPGLVGDEIENGFSAAGIGFRREHSRGLVEHQPVVSGWLSNCFSIDCDLVAIDIDALSRPGDLAVDSNSAGGHQLLGAAARGHARSCERALNPHDLTHQICACA